MRNTITLNGIKSSDIAGLLIQSLPPISKPLMRTEIEEIDGRDGDIVTNLGFSAYDKEIIIGLYGDFDINQVIAYFNSEGVVVFSNEPDKYYNYQIINQIDFDRLLRYRTATVTMHCQPFKYSTTETPVTLGSNPPTTVSGEGSDIVLQNTSEAPFDQIDLKGDISQTTYTGKNLVPYPYQGSGNNNGITFTPNSDGSVTLNGQNNNNGHSSYNLFYSTDNPLVLSAGTYYMIQPSNTNVMFSSYDGSHYYDYKPDNGYSNTFDSSVSLRNLYIQVRKGNTTVFDNYTVYPMLSTLPNQTEADYEPYVGSTPTQITPSPNPNYPQDINVVTSAQTVTVHGRNIFDKDNANLIQGYFDGSSATSTINTGSTGRNRVIWLPCRPNTAYSFLFTNMTDINNPQIGTTTELPASGVTVTRLGTINGTTGKLENQTTPADAKYIVIRIQTKAASININTALPLVLAGLDIEQSTSITAYEAYQEQRYLVGLYGKNMFDKDDTTNRLNSVYINGTSGSGTLGSSTNARCVYVPIEAGKTYTVSKVATNYSYFRIGTTETKPRLNVVVNDIQSTSGSSTSLTLTASAGSKYLVVWWGRVDYSPSESDVLASIQIEEGETATTYEAYTTIELCKIGDYQDYFYKDGDDWYLHKEVGKLDMSTLSGWTKSNNGFYLSGFGSSYAIYQVYSNIFTYSTTTWESGGKIGITSAGNLWITFEGWDALSSSDVPTWLANKNAVLYGVLATATDTKITDNNLINQLESVSNAYSWNPITYIIASSAATNIPIIISATAAGNMDGTITNSGNTTARPKLTIYGSGDIAIYLNGVQLFQIALGTEGYITIDTNAMEAYKDTTDNLKNRLVIGDYSNFVLNPGANQIGFSGNTTMCVVENYSRWL